MVKRFLLGFAVGVGLMYYYLHHGDEVATNAKEWGTKAASNYRADPHKKAVDELLSGRKH